MNSPSSVAWRWTASTLPGVLTMPLSTPTPTRRVGMLRRMGRRLAGETDMEHDVIHAEALAIRREWAELLAMSIERERTREG